MNAASPFSAHNDVLDAPVPLDAEGRLRLLTEVKNRARSAVEHSIWPHALQLYRKALECVDDNQNEKAILNANLSLVQGKMNLWEDAESSATEATLADPSYTKGFWRLSQAKAAKKNWNDAVRAMEKALSLEPESKALQKELEKLRSQQALALSDPSSASQQTTYTMTSATSQSTEASVGKTTGLGKDSSDMASKPSSDEMEINGVEDGAEFTKSDQVRGYKVVNGKKTSYFHNELSEEAAKLIGDIAPKRLDETVVAATDTSLESASTKGASVWNKAGTWEEKDATQFAIESLKNVLLQTSYIMPGSSPAPNAVISITKVDITGHASVAAVRGKKRYIYEFSLSLEWKFQHNSIAAQGRIQFPDVDGTCALGEGYDASNFDITQADDNTVRPTLEMFVHKQGLRNAIHTTIDDWVKYFQDSY